MEGNRGHRKACQLPEHESHHCRRRERWPSDYHGYEVVPDVMNDEVPSPGGERDFCAVTASRSLDTRRLRRRLAEVGEVSVPYPRIAAGGVCREASPA